MRNWIALRINSLEQPEKCLVQAVGVQAVFLPSSPRSFTSHTPTHFPHPLPNHTRLAASTSSHAQRYVRSAGPSHLRPRDHRSPSGRCALPLSRPTRLPLGRGSPPGCCPGRSRLVASPVCARLSTISPARPAVVPSITLQVLSQQLEPAACGLTTSLAAVRLAQRALTPISPAVSPCRAPRRRPSRFPPSRCSGLVRVPARPHRAALDPLSMLLGPASTFPLRRLSRSHVRSIFGSSR